MHNGKNNLPASENYYSSREMRNLTYRLIGLLKVNGFTEGIRLQQIFNMNIYVWYIEYRIVITKAQFILRNFMFILNTYIWYINIKQN
jgi:hypothetical protein